MNRRHEASHEQLFLRTGLLLWAKRLGNAIPITISQTIVFILNSVYAELSKADSELVATSGNSLN